MFSSGKRFEVRQLLFLSVLRATLDAEILAAAAAAVAPPPPPTPAHEQEPSRENTHYT